MSFVDPQTQQNPTTGLVATDGWGDAVDASFNWLRNAKVGCRVTSVTGTTIGTDTVMSWATETFDVGACHDNVTNNSRITVPTSWGGLWLVGFNLEVDTGSGIQVQAWIVRNGTTKLCGDATHTGGATPSGCDAETVYVMAAGDYFEVWASGTSSPTRSTTVTSKFYAWWLASGV